MDIMIDGVGYSSIPDKERDSCSGCALDGDDKSENCEKAIGIYSCTKNSVIWVKSVPAGFNQKYPPQSASSFLTDAEKTMQQRASQHDSPEGERSMGKTIAAFNAITGRDLTESEGWLLMLILKQVRQWQKIDYHADSAIDSVAYSALLAESLAAGK